MATDVIQKRESAFVHLGLLARDAEIHVHQENMDQIVICHVYVITVQLAIPLMGDVHVHLDGQDLHVSRE